MWVFIAVVIVAAVFILLLVAATKAPEFRIEREILINSPPAKVFGLIDDFRQWALWSPWEAMEADGALQKTYSGPERGVGAHYGWSGPKTGVGQMDITTSVPNSQILIRLEFTKPMKAVNLTEFEIIPQGAETKVVWSMSGAQPFMHRLMGIFFSMDNMVGGQFAQGLAKMKETAET